MIVVAKRRRRGGRKGRYLFSINDRADRKDKLTQVHTIHTKLTRCPTCLRIFRTSQHRRHDRPFRSFRAPKPFSEVHKIDRFWGSKIVKGSVGDWLSIFSLPLQNTRVFLSLLLLFFHWILVVLFVCTSACMHAADKILLIFGSCLNEKPIRVPATDGVLRGKLQFFYSGCAKK